MYKLKVLPSVKREINRTRLYIADELCNVPAAIKLMKDIRKAMHAIKNNPNIGKSFEPEKELKHKHHQKIVRGYILLYWVGEASGVITVSYIFNTKTSYKARVF